MEDSSLLPDFIKVGDVPAELIERYRGRVPGPVIDYWEHQGFGTAAQGFLKAIDPDVYLDALGDCLPASGLIPIFATALADIIVYDGRHVLGLQYRYGGTLGISQRLLGFGQLLRDDEYLDEDLEWQPYPQALAMHGPLDYEECFCSTPLRGLGGAGLLESMTKGDLITHVRLITEVTGGIDWS